MGWRANKQNTVTTSTTEAELLSLSQGAKEGQFVKRLLNELSVSLDDQRIRIHCDNRQSIRLVTEEIARLQTKLRHVDIHNHWLRQEVRDGRITVEHISTKKMIANGPCRRTNLTTSSGRSTSWILPIRSRKEELDHNAIQMLMGDEE